MSHVLVLIANPAAPVLDDALLAAARQSLAAQGAQTETPRWLAPGIAAEITFTGAPPALSSLAPAWDGQPIDGAILATENRRKRLLIADMDSTMIEVECIDEIADALGLKEKVAVITERAMEGELPFDEALRERVSLLKGLAETALDEVYRTRVRFTPGGASLVQTMAAHGAVTALVSGGFTYFTDRVAKTLGFGYSRANRLEIGADGALTGKVIEPIQGREAKRAALLSLSAENGLDVRDALAVGDGANDLAMIEAAGLGVAFRAKPKVAAAADIAITHSDLSALLYLQGYAQDEIVSGEAAHG